MPVALDEAEFLRFYCYFFMSSLKFIIKPMFILCLFRSHLNAIKWAQRAAPIMDDVLSKYTDYRKLATELRK